MNHAEIWRNLLVKWPRDIPQHGVVITSYGEQVAFVNFLLSEQLALFERRAPDAVGGRKLIVAYDKIDAIKIVSPIESKAFAPLGFLELPSPTAAAT